MPDPGTRRPRRIRPAWVDLAISALNGAVGDALHARGNGLAIAMAFHDTDGPLALEPDALAAALPAPTGKLCILVHGLCVNERVWRYREDPTLDYGRLLQRDLGFTPFYLRYNTGLHISQNGRRLAALLEQLFRAYPRPVEELTLIGHSMGGLVLRSACFYGVEAGHAWPRTSLACSRWGRLIRAPRSSRPSTWPPGSSGGFPIRPPVSPPTSSMHAAPG
jgi:triacylglycerol lipase